MSEVKLTLHPNDLRIGTTVRLEDGCLYDVAACDDRQFTRELKAKPSSADDAEMSVSFNDEVRSYGDLYKVVSIDMVSWSSHARIALEKVKE